jgi:heme/copper-type cytochrome/quinol oxidase subunit 4
MSRRPETPAPVAVFIFVALFAVLIAIGALWVMT